MPSKVIYSGADRTLQCATYAQLAFDLEAVPEIHRGFFQDDLVIKCFGSDFAAFVAEIRDFYKSGQWSVAQALQISDFARQARKQIQKSVIEVAEHHGDSIVFSHSPMGNLGTTKPEEVEYDYGLADTVVYYVERGKIVDSEYISCPPEEE